jgi:hypothetical protein
MNAVLRSYVEARKKGSRCVTILALSESRTSRSTTMAERKPIHSESTSDTAGLLESVEDYDPIKALAGLRSGIGLYEAST